MRNPEIAMNKLEKLEGKLKTMYVMLTRPRYHSGSIQTNS
jgi:hypothetical protein